MRFAPPLDAVLFDMDGTLVDSGAYFRRQVAWDLALSPFRGKLGPIALMRVLREFPRVRARLQRLPIVPDLHDVQMDLTAERLRLSPAAVRHVVSKLIYESDFEGLDRFTEADTRAALERLKARRLKLGVLSDYPARNKLEGMRLLDLGWDVVMSAEDVNSLKPNPRLFEQALQQLGLEPRRALYVGNQRDKDVAGAQAAGMHTCLIHGSRHKGPEPDFEVRSLSELADQLGC